MAFQCGFTSIFPIMSKNNTFSCFGAIFISLFVTRLCFCPLFLPNFKIRATSPLSVGSVMDIFSQFHCLRILSYGKKNSLSTLWLKWHSRMFSSDAYMLSFSWLWYLFSSPFFFFFWRFLTFCQVKKVNKSILFRNFGGVYQESFRGLNPLCCWKHK